MVKGPYPLQSPIVPVVPADSAIRRQKGGAMQTRQLVHFAATTSLLHRPAPACGLASRVPPIAYAGDTGAIPRNETQVTHCSEIASTNERISRSGSNLVDTST